MLVKHVVECKGRRFDLLRQVQLSLGLVHQDAAVVAEIERLDDIYLSSVGGLTIGHGALAEQDSYAHFISILLLRGSCGWIRHLTLMLGVKRRA